MASDLARGAVGEFSTIEEAVEAIRRGVRPTNLPKDEQAIYDFADEFLRTRTVSDATLNAARERLEESYHWFTEGFDTADLQEAMALRAALV